MNKRNMLKKKARTTTDMAEEPIPPPEDGMAEQPVEPLIPELKEYGQVAEW